MVRRGPLHLLDPIIGPLGRLAAKAKGVFVGVSVAVIGTKANQM